MTFLYPEIEPYKTHKLKVSDLHTIYIEESGNPQGTPLLKIHGWPGSKSSAKRRRLYNPQEYRIIQYDQRGCGQSTPQGEIRENTTQDLIQDIEKTRKHLWIEKRLIDWASWWATLALAYTQDYQKHVSGLLLRAVFLWRKKEQNRLWGDSPLQNIVPEQRKNYIKNIPEEDKKNPLEYFKKTPRNKISNQNIENLYKREESLLNLDIPAWPQRKLSESDKLHANIVIHYIKNSFFLSDIQLLQNNARENIPVSIIQWRYDLICPYTSAREVHKTIADSKIETVTAWHYATNDHLIKKIDEEITLLKKLSHEQL